MKKLLLIALNFLIISILPAHTVTAKAVDFKILSATPEGSWQVREHIETSAKGKKTGTTLRTSMLGSEMRNGAKHYWIEVAIDSFKISKKGKRKARGKRSVMKSLISESVLKGDPENILSNLGGFAVETIIQNGKDQPMRISDSGGMMSGLMKAFGTQMEYQYTDQGSESVTVSAGEFETSKISGKGSVEMKIIFKKMRVESESIAWMSANVPFGVVRMEVTSTTNGKPSSSVTELLEFGKSGAVSEITEEPQDMPAMPNVGELFGN